MPLLVLFDRNEILRNQKNQAPINVVAMDSSIFSFAATYILFSTILRPIVTHGPEGWVMNSKEEGWERTI